MNIDSDFFEQISYLDIESISSNEDVTYIVDRNLRLRAYNDAWSNFAKDNNGKTVLETFPLGSKIIDAGAGPIQHYIAEAYWKALKKNQPLFHDYECSSPEKFRVFHQTVYPLVESRGLFISNHLVVEKPHTLEETKFQNRFKNKNGNIVQCANCRKIRDPVNAQIWLWVPSLLKHPVTNISHGICTPCLEHYYPDIDND